jgi:DNA topoisomerase-1
MGKNLVIVESPAKARTIEKYLGEDFQVLASYGHVRDLVPKEGAVDPERDFAMKYQLIEKNEKHVDKIASAVKKAAAVYLATDPDREGEAISWHVFEVLKDRKLLDGKKVQRVVFHEITKRAINEAIEHPRELSDSLVSAQQARRALDYLVGFNLSPLLWKKIRRGLSAGRVQSPALRLIVERDEEIRAFKAREYWTIEADCANGGQAFPARLAIYAGQKVISAAKKDEEFTNFTFTDEASTRAAESAIAAAAGGFLRVAAVDKSQRKRNPAAPFITSTLQQEASRKLGFSAQKTMMIAQKLYEGIDTGEGATGLITYMRTDSVTLANEALAEIREMIASRFGAENLPESPRLYKTKARNAQEAHEAIRPTLAAKAPEDIKSHLDHDQFRLYELIWRRTIASQMNPAVYDTVALDLVPQNGKAEEIVLRATGSVLVSPGFIAVYLEGEDDSVADEEDHVLPALVEGDVIALQRLRSEQHFTEPPPRYSEATLVKALEELGIGRPSTYASIISTLRAREYVEVENRRFTPTDVGRVVNRFLKNFFDEYVEYEFTARMEDSLDEISRGESESVPLLDQFWKPFIKRIDKVEKEVTRDWYARPLGKDPKSGRPVSVRMGQYGAFVQIGTREDEDKPLFAGLRPGQKMDEIGFDEAMALFQLPRALGQTPEGEDVSASIGRFGPYVRYGSKFASLKEDDPYKITLERALEVIAAKKLADANRLILDFPEQGIQVLNGRYGPYITNKAKNAKIPKDRVPSEVTLEECQALLAAAPERRGRGMRRQATPPAANAAADANAAPAEAAKPVKKKAKKKKKNKKKAAAPTPDSATEATPAPADESPAE